MPWESVWVMPDLVMEYKGVKVYETYKYNDAGSERSRTFTLNPVQCEEDKCGCEGEECVNIVRMDDLPNWKEPPHPPYTTMSNPVWKKASKKRRAEIEKEWALWHKTRQERKFFKRLLQEAIDKGIISKDGLKVSDDQEEKESA